jgi:hypothetical protein
MAIVKSKVIFFMMVLFNANLIKNEFVKPNKSELY